MAGPYPLRADTIVEVPIGPAIAVGDGFTPVTTLTIAGADEAELIKHGATTSGGLAGTLAAYTAVVDGYYHLDLSATETDTEGQLTIVIQDDSLILPIRNDFVVLNAVAYDALYAADGTDTLNVNVTTMAANSIATGVIATDAIGTTAMAANSIAADVMAAGSIATGVMATDSIGTAAMAAGSISAGTIASGELTNIENEIWDALKSAHVGANSFGDFLDIEVSGRLASADINLTAGVLDEVAVLTGHTAQTADHTAGIADIPTVSEFNARTILSADYFDPTADAVANVTLVATTTTATNLTTNNDKTGYQLSATGVDDIWDETLAGHVTADTTGLLLNDWQDAGRLDAILDTIAADVVNIDGIVPSAAGDAMTLTAAAVDLIWDELMAGHVTVDSAGEVMNDWQNGGRLDNILDARMAEASIDTTGGAVDLVTTTTTATNLTTNNDKTGYALSASGVDDIWDETLAGHVTADTTGLLLNEWQDGGRLDLILDIIAVDTTTDIPALIATVQADLDTITGADGVILLSGTQTSIDAIETDTASLNDGAIAEIAQGVPSATPTLQNAVMLLYMTLRNKFDSQTSGTDAMEIHNDAGTQIAIKLLTDDGSDYSEAKMTTGV